MGVEPLDATRQARDVELIQQALQLAERAESDGEVPVGALIVKDGRVIGTGWNQPIGANDPTAHAEIVALRAAADSVQSYRLPGTTLYVTLEPCAMCATAMVHARVARLVFGAWDPQRGAAGSAFQLVQSDALNHRIEISGGVLENECGQFLREFFEARR